MQYQRYGSEAPEEPEVNALVEEALEGWREEGCRDRHVTGRDGMTASVYFHERFSMGGMLFTVDVRRPGPEGSLIHRERVSLT